MVVHFAFMFHIYQPPTQIPMVIKQITNECYRPLIDALKTHPSARITLNINGTLTEQLHDYGFQDVIQGLAELGNKGQIEFTGSAKFHPLLPLIPEPEILRQIQLNNDTNKYFFGKAYHPRGFFPPEMAVSDDIHGPVKQLGFDWMIMGGIANTAGWPTRTFSRHPNGLILVFRDDVISIDCAFDKVNNVEAFANRLKYQDSSKDYYVILAMDGETFGHHIKHAFRNFLVPLFDNLPHRGDIQLCTISEIIAKYPRGEVQVPRPSSWSTMSYDLQRDVPFPLWFEKDNPIHLDQYRVMMYATVLVNLASKLHESMNDEKREALKNARNFLDRAIYSCQTWWASKRPWYSRDMILRGLNELILAAVNARASIPDFSVDVKDAGSLIMDALLRCQNSIILALS
ncbi:MAG: hypothetical protein GYA24_01660 [Candidatus Lokiarchaeota archaeon]|nr:hypothetical protein [Candidatus Lokiarchaeota archaeon]